VNVIVFVSITFQRQTIWSKNVSQPWVTESFRQRDAMLWIDHQHFSDQVLGFKGSRNRELDVHFDLALVQAFHGRCFEWYCSLQHDIQQYPQRPYVNIEIAVLAIA